MPFAALGHTEAALLNVSTKPSTDTEIISSLVSLGATTGTKLSDIQGLIVQS